MATREQDSETEVELHIDLGYAEAAADDFVETDSLAEMDEIQVLPLAEMVLEEDPDDPLDALANAEQKRQIATLEAIVFEGDNPNAPAPKYARSAAESVASGEDPLGPQTRPDAERPAHDRIPPPVVPPAAASQVKPPPITPPSTKPLPTKSENPFLPQHILDRLNQGKRNLVEEIAQSSAALDASTAILRTHARADRLTRSSYGEAKPQQHHAFTRDKSAQQKQKIVDDLVEEYLPLIAAELRRRLRKILDE